MSSVTWGCCYLDSGTSLIFSSNYINDIKYMHVFNILIPESICLQKSTCIRISHILLDQQHICIQHLSIKCIYLKLHPIMSESPSKDKKEIDQYEIIRELGKGAYGQVVLAKRDGKLFALKKIEKKKLAKEKKQYQAFIEKEILRKMEHPGIITLSKCFQDGKYLYYALEYCHGSDFTIYIKKYNQQLTDEIKRFYVAEIVSVLEYLHSVGITHRDLKPENMMLSKEGHLKLIDFGTAQISRCTLVDEAFKQNIANLKKQSTPDILHELTQQQQIEEGSPRKRKSTFVGTFYYLSPELLQHNICEPPSDLWALGCILYQLYYSEPPFKGSQYQIFEKIKNMEINYPKKEGVSEQAIDLIKKLIRKDPNERIGSNSGEGLMYADLKKHPYFEGVNFENIFQQPIPQIKQAEKKEDSVLRAQKISQQIQDSQIELLKREEVIMHGPVEMRTFALYTLSYLVLQANAKMYEIELYSPEKHKPLKVQLFKDGIAAEYIGENKFKIMADQTLLTIRSDRAEEWVQAITKSFGGK